MLTPPPAGNLVTVTFTPPLPDRDCCKIELSGDVNDTFYVRMLEGDVNFTGVNSSADAATVKQRLGKVLSSSNFRVDLNVDGLITTADYASVKQRLGRTVVQCPDCP